MSKSGEPELELERLARRIAWLDRYRRPLAILLSLILTPLILWWMFGWFPSNWPGFHIGMLGIMGAAIAWYCIETFLGFLIAVWETDYSKLTRPAELPRAQIVNRDKK